MEETACKVRISGRVTGVGFRYFTMKEADKFPGLKGYVRNIGYGEVEVLLQGKRNSVEQMIEYLRRGPFTARVDHIEISPVACDDSLQGFNAF